MLRSSCTGSVGKGFDKFSLSNSHGELSQCAVWTVAQDGTVELSKPCARNAGKDVGTVATQGLCPLSDANLTDLNVHRKVYLSLLGSADISEIYSPPRFTAQAPGAGLRGGIAVDLATQRRDGLYWDLSRREHEKELERTQKEEKPYLLTGSPPCDPFSQMQRINKNRTDLKESMEDKLVRG